MFVVPLLTGMAPAGLAVSMSEEEVDVEEIEIEGTIKAIKAEGTVIVVDDKLIYIDAETEFDGMLAVGAEAKVMAERRDGLLFATEIEVDEDVRLEGMITKLVLRPDGTGWLKVNYIKVLIDTDTEIEDMLKVGDEVRIDAVVHHGHLLAERIRVED